MKVGRRVGIEVGMKAGIVGMKVGNIWMKVGRKI